jgi:hypothetical protein
MASECALFSYGIFVAAANSLSSDMQHPHAVDPEGGDFELHSLNLFGAPMVKQGRGLAHLIETNNAPESCSRSWQKSSRRARNDAFVSDCKSY